MKGYKIEFNVLDNLLNRRFNGMFKY